MNTAMNRMMAGRERAMAQSDNVFVRVISDGREMMNFRKSGYASISDVIATVSRMASGLWGLAKLIIRNQSRGWSVEVPLALQKESRRFASLTAPRHDARGQYLLFA